MGVGIFEEVSLVMRSYYELVIYFKKQNIYICQLDWAIQLRTL
jgi:hypothetical protein